MRQKLRGKRTYIVGLLMLLTAAGLWLTGDLSGAEAIRQAYEALGLLGLRAAFPQALAASVETGLESFRAPSLAANAAASPDAQEAIRAALEAHLERIYTTPPKDIDLKGDSRVITREIVGMLAP